MFDWNKFEDIRAVPLHVTDNVNYTRFNMDYKYGEDRRAKRNAWTGSERRNDADWLPPQSVDATHALNLSAGVSNSNVLRGRSLNRRATLFK